MLQEALQKLNKIKTKKQEYAVAGLKNYQQNNITNHVETMWEIRRCKG